MERRLKSARHSSPDTFKARDESWRRVPKSCSKCAAAAVILVPYSGQHLCRRHFLDFTERRIRKAVREQGPYPKGSHVVVALSGGKDSVVTLRVLADVFRENRHVRVSAVTVDEGIAAYRPPSIGVARRHCEALGVPHHVVSYAKEAGVTMDEMKARDPALLACGACGPLRRRSLNRAARELGATHVATGHNLDDSAQSVLMNFLKGDVERLARLGPHPAERAKPGLVPRLMPLRAVPEKEVALFAMLHGWEFHDAECPYSSDATRGRYRDLLLSLERETPGTRHALLAGYDRLAPLLHAGLPAAEVRACSRCGEPASRDRCAACATSTERPEAA